MEKVAGIAISQGRRPIQWSEVFDHFKTELPKDVIVHIWKSVTNVTEVVADGYNVLLNVGYDSTSWYLDNLNVDWHAVYAQDPCGGSPSDLCKLILGGHGEMWGEVSAVMGPWLACGGFVSVIVEQKMTHAAPFCCGTDRGRVRS